VFWVTRIGASLICGVIRQDDPVHVDPSVLKNWIALQHAADGSVEYEELFPVFDVVYNMVRKRPEEALVFILEVLRNDDSSVIAENLSAGPLEDLLVYHGATLIDRIEQEAKRNRKFAWLLGGVWQNAMPESVWLRVQKARDRRGWDGNPPA
jgi:hypothetical protein